MRDRNLLIVNMEKHKITVRTWSPWPRRNFECCALQRGAKLWPHIALMRTESWEGPNHITGKRKSHFLLLLSSPAGRFLSCIIWFSSRLPWSYVHRFQQPHSRWKSDQTGLDARLSAPSRSWPSSSFWPHWTQVSCHGPWCNGGAVVFSRGFLSSLWPVGYEMIVQGKAEVLCSAPPHRCLCLGVPRGQ